jgi:hypothetical protein
LDQKEKSIRMLVPHLDNLIYQGVVHIDRSRETVSLLSKPHPPDESRKTAAFDSQPETPDNQPFKPAPWRF